MTKDILFEIGCEELPATNLADIFSHGIINPATGNPENILENRLRKTFEEIEVSLEFVDTRSLHDYGCEVHCGTSVIRACFQ